MLKTKKIVLKFRYIFLLHDLYIKGVINCFFANNLQKGTFEMLSEQQQKHKINYTQSVNL